MGVTIFESLIIVKVFVEAVEECEFSFVHILASTKDIW